VFRASNSCATCNTNSSTGTFSVRAASDRSWLSQIGQHKRFRVKLLLPRDQRRVDAGHSSLSFSTHIHGTGKGIRRSLGIDFKKLGRTHYAGTSLKSGADTRSWDDSQHVRRAIAVKMEESASWILVLTFFLCMAHIAHIDSLPLYAA